MTESDGTSTYCTVTSVLDIFYDAEFISSPPSFLDTIEAKVNTLSDTEIKSTIDLRDYHTWSGDVLSERDILSRISDRVVAFNVAIHLKNNEITKNGESRDKRAEAWEREWIQRLNGVQVEGAPSLRQYVLAMVSAYDATIESMTGDVSKFLFGYLLLMIYIFITLGELNRVKSRITLAFLSLISVGLAVAATLGLSSAFGLFYGPVHQLLPLLMLGIGIDDAYVIVTAFDNVDQALPLRQRVAFALAEAGTAVTVTSFTNSCAFFIGATTAIPALRYFAISAAVGILFDFFLQTTFFVAFLTFDARRQEAKKMDVITCVTVENVSPVNIFGSEPGILSRFFHDRFSPWIVQKHVRFGCIVLSLSMFAVALYGTTELKQEFEPEFFFLDGSYQRKFDEINDIYFPQYIIPVNIYTGTMDYADEDIQRRMNKLFGQSGYVLSDDYIVNDSLSSWYVGFRASEAILNDVDAVIEPEQYYLKLQDFLETENGSRFRNDLVFNDKSTLKASRSLAFLTNIATNDDQVDAMLSIRQSVEKATLPDAFPFTLAFIYFEQYVVIKSETIKIVFSSLAVVFFVSVILIGDPYAAFIVLLGVGLSVVDILGVVHFWDINLNSVSVINLSIAVGLTIDYSAHIGLAFMEAVGTRRERVTTALKALGPPLIHGGISTLLVISVLAFARSYIFRVFFKMFILIIGFGIFHGMVVVPQTLSLFGPDSFYQCKADKEAEMQEIADHVLDLEKESDATLITPTTSYYSNVAS